MSEEESLNALIPESTPETTPASTPAPILVPIAPVWHTIVLIVGILALSIVGRAQMAPLHQHASRLLTYGSTVLVEVAMLGWVALGLRLRKVPFRSLFGNVAAGLRGVGLDLGAAFVFWIGSLMILGTLAGLWAGVEYAIHNRHAPAERRNHPSSRRPQRSKPYGLSRDSRPRMRPKLHAGCPVRHCGIDRGDCLSRLSCNSNSRIGTGQNCDRCDRPPRYCSARRMDIRACATWFCLLSSSVLFSVLAIFRRGLRARIFCAWMADMIAGLALAALRSHHLV